MKLYSYWRSSCSWRVRIGLQLKGIPHQLVAVNLLEGEQASQDHRDRNPMGQVPVLELDDGRQLVQSMAMLDYLDRIQPEPPLLPDDPYLRAHALGLAEIVNTAIQPLQNLSVLKAVDDLGGDRAAWGRQVIEQGLTALQERARPHAGAFLVGDTVSLADLFLVPQLYNARRFRCDLGPLSLLTAIEARCEALPAFQRAHPSVQPDAVG